MLVNITVNQDGFIGVWIDQPIKMHNKWIGKVMFINSLVYNKIKKIVKDTQMSWESDYITIPI